MSSKLIRFFKEYGNYIFYVLVLSLLIFFIFRNFLIIEEYKKLDDIKLKQEKKEKVIEKENIDTDNDGLFDWQEVLYKTDLENPDSDGDGVFDGKEVEEETNPLSFDNDKNEDIEIIKESIENIESQISKRIDEQEKKQQIKKIEYKSTLSAEEKEKINKYKKDSVLIKSDMNILGEIFLDNFYSINSDEEGLSIFLLFNNLVPGSYDKGVDILKKNNNTGALGRIPEFRKLSNDEISSIENKIKYYAVIADLLKKKGDDMKSEGFEYYYKGLYDSYSGLYKHTKNLLVFYIEGEEDIDLIVKEIKGYTLGARDLADIYGSIDRMIDIRNLEIKDNEPASYFDLKM